MSNSKISRRADSTPKKCKSKKSRMSSSRTGKESTKASSNPVTKKQSCSSPNSSIGFFYQRTFPNDEEHRHPLGHNNGGKICGDKQNVNKIRSIGKEMIKIVGKKVLSGDLNLTRISFPIRAMVPKTAL